VCVFDWVSSAITSTGYVGIALLMFLENIFPPIPSEVIMPLAGYTAARGELSFVGTVVAGTVGSLVGAYMWYAIGRRLGPGRIRRFAARHGRWLTLAPQDVDRARSWFERHGGAAVLIGRLVPAVRTFISVPAGFACMGRPSFLLYSAVGTAAWTTLLTGAGWLLGQQYQLVADYMDPITTAVLVLAGLYYIYRVITFQSQEA
jgi:membrane protein DedA with SNARE-associated domain